MARVWAVTLVWGVLALAAPACAWVHGWDTVGSQAWVDFAGEGYAFVPTLSQLEFVANNYAIVRCVLCASGVGIRLPLRVCEYRLFMLLSCIVLCMVCKHHRPPAPPLSLLLILPLLRSLEKCFAMRNFSTNEEAVANVTATLKAFNPKVLVM